MADDSHDDRPTDDGQTRDLRGRKKVYFWLMGLCILLIVLAWNVVRLWSVPAAVAMSAVAAVIPPAAAILGNRSSGA